MSDTTPAERLEMHLAREFVQAYIINALGNRKAVKIDPHRLFMAARFSGLKVSSRTMNKVIEDLQQN